MKAGDLTHLLSATYNLRIHQRSLGRRRPWMQRPRRGPKGSGSGVESNSRSPIHSADNNESSESSKHLGPTTGFACSKKASFTEGFLPSVAKFNSDHLNPYTTNRNTTNIHNVKQPFLANRAGGNLSTQSLSPPYHFTLKHPSGHYN